MPKLAATDGSQLEIPPELKAVIARHCCQGTLYNLALAHSTWLLPCNDALYQSICMTIDMSRDASKAVRLFRNLSLGKHRPQRVTALYIDVISPHEIPFNGLCDDCTISTGSPCQTRSAELLPSEYQVHAGYSRRTISEEKIQALAQTEPRACINFAEPNRLILLANISICLPLMESLRDLCVFPSDEGYNTFLDITLSKLATVPEDIPLRFVHLSSRALDVQFHTRMQIDPFSPATAGFTELLKMLSQSRNKSEFPMIVHSSRLAHAGIALQALTLKKIAYFEIDPVRDAIAFRLDYLHSTMEFDVGDFLQAIAAFDPPQWATWQLLDRYRILRILLRPDQTHAIGPLVTTVSRLCPAVSRVYLDFEPGGFLPTPAARLSATQLVTALLPLSKLAAVEVDGAVSEVLGCTPDQLSAVAHCNGLNSLNFVKIGHQAVGRA
ncbi:hypothetical protein BKA62DRAFT_739404 [Auriculariales sp. MPI-PUGE-AT-0066]|nr:hypothetical protein BKA62DRAFT_739404 [Auriculariales sp. MPI-PUGE-AT-0066]